MRTFERMCIKPLQGEGFELVVGKTYLTSSELGDGTVMVFKGVWFTVNPADHFSSCHGFYKMSSANDHFERPKYTQDEWNGLQDAFDGFKKSSDGSIRSRDLLIIKLMGFVASCRFWEGTESARNLKLEAVRLYQEVREELEKE